MELWSLRLLHITAATIWVGASVATAYFVLPAIGASGPAGGAVMRGIVERRFPLVMNVLAFVVVLTGARLYMIHYSTEWLSTGAGIMLSVGGVLGVMAAIVGATVIRSVATKLGALSAQVARAGAPPSAEQSEQLERLGQRIRNATRHNALAMIVAAVCMAGARFAPF